MSAADGSLSDAELVARAARGDAAAFGALVERHEARVYGVAFRLLRDRADAEEVAQEAFLAALEHLPGFRGEAAFGTWIHRVAANAALMRIRKRSTSPLLPDVALGDAQLEGEVPRYDANGHLDAGPQHDWSKRADDQLHDAEIRRAVEDAVANLPEDYRITFLLRDVEGLSIEEMAEVLGASVPAVKSRLHRARLVLRERLGKFLE